MEGSYALGIICTDDENTLYCAKNGSPLIIGKGNGENFIASDINPLLAHTNNAIYLEDGETAKSQKIQSPFTIKTLQKRKKKQND